MPTEKKEKAETKVTEKDSVSEEKKVEKKKPVEKKTAEKKTVEMKAPQEYVLTDEIRKKAMEKPRFSILYVGDGDSRLSPFRGESMMRTFATFYERHADIDYCTVSSSRFAKMTLADLKDVNILWLDNVSFYKATKNLADIQAEMMEQTDPGWKETFNKLREEDIEKAIKYADDLNEKRANNIRIIYCIDEFIWEGVAGRSRDIQSVQLMETCMNVADSVVVPNPELKEAIEYYKFIQNPKKEIYTIPSSVGVEFFPLFKDYTKKGRAELIQLGEKPKVLIKGVAIPKNIEDFIFKYYKKFDITLSSVDEVNEHVNGLLQLRKISHMQHWANPYVNKGNLTPTYATERDAGFNFVIHTKPDDLTGNIYELANGDEDILFSISYGALPICGIKHLDYEDSSNHLSMASGITFGKDTPAKKIAAMIERYQTPALFNEAYGKCRSMVENRLSTSPLIISRYFALMLGKEIAKARALMARERQEEMKKEAEEAEKKSEKTEKSEKSEEKKTAPENVIEGNFKKKDENVVQ